ncbi:MAG: hypothetical protein PHY25_05380 [Dehalococcoidales bacterium]|nr:hypothetical protein [Dehalococcoidales bacterium]
MAKYETVWLDGKLESGNEYAVGVCTYSRKVRHLIIGKDPFKRMILKSVNIEGEACSSAAHCLALSCPLNHTGKEHLAHMLDMSADEKLDEATAEAWGTDSTIEGLMKFVDKINESLPEDLNNPDQSTDTCPE